jgi:hypothetical protein
MPCCESILAVTARWLISECGFCSCDIRSWKSHVWWFLGMKELLNLLQRCYVGRTGPIPWPGRSCDFTLLDILWSNVTEPFKFKHVIFVKEGLTKIEHVLRPAVFWDFTQHKVVIPFWCFRITKMSKKNMSWKQSVCIYLMSVRAAECYWAYIVVADFQGRHRLVWIYKKTVNYLCFTSFWTRVLWLEMGQLIQVLLTHHNQLQFWCLIEFHNTSLVIYYLCNWFLTCILLCFLPLF